VRKHLPPIEELEQKKYALGIPNIGDKSDDLSEVDLHKVFQKTKNEF